MPLDLTPKGYCDRTDVAQYLGITIEESDEAKVDTYIRLAEALIERQTGRIFKADTSFSDRYFSGGDNGSLRIDDAIAIEDVEVYDEFGALNATLTGTSYDFYPYNELPIRRLDMKPNINDFFLRGRRNIKVSGKWGYTVEPPELISFATMVLAAGMLNNSLDTKGEVASERIGEYQVTYKTPTQWSDFTQVKDVITSYTSPKKYV